MLRLVDFFQMRGPPENTLTEERIFEMMKAENLFEADGIHKMEDLRQKHRDMMVQYKKDKQH